MPGEQGHAVARHRAGRPSRNHQKSSHLWDAAVIQSAAYDVDSTGQRFVLIVRDEKEGCLNAGFGRLPAVHDRLRLPVPLPAG